MYITFFFTCYINLWIGLNTKKKVDAEHARSKLISDCFAYRTKEKKLPTKSTTKINKNKRKIKNQLLVGSGSYNLTFALAHFLRRFVFVNISSSFDLIPFNKIYNVIRSTVRYCVDAMCTFKTLCFLFSALNLTFSSSQSVFCYYCYKILLSTFSYDCGIYNMY